jgi:DNA helicase II / ATP-dependent DNA helicase PcrA
MPTQTPHAILEALNDQQRQAAEQVTGPVQILAGAGTGKTTTVTHRIAWQVASSAWQARDLLAVTFTRKAAGELVERLGRLGVEGVEARTFHGASFWMLRFLWPHYTGQALPELVQSKARILNGIVQGLPAPYCFRARRDVATDIEWAKGQRVAAAGYAAAVERSGRTPSLPPDLGQRVFLAYEQECRRLGQWDFDDLLVRLLGLFEEHPEAAERIRARFGSITVDEYQDVSPLQQALLDQWVGDRDDLCVVGDDLQTVYSFTGASPSYLVDFPSRYPAAKVAVLETNYRSTPEVLEVANRLATRFGARARTLRSAVVDGDGAVPGPTPVVQAHAGDAAEAAWVAEEAERLHRELGLPW